MSDPPLRGLLICANNPAVTCPDAADGARRPGARGPVHRRARPVHDRHGALCRYRAAGGDLPGDRGFLPRLRRLLHAVRAGAPWRRRTRRGRISALRRSWRGGWASRTASSPCRRSEIVPLFFAGREGRGGRGRSGASCSTRHAIKVAPKGEGQEFRTPSGKLEIYSGGRWRPQGLPPMPDWEADRRRSAPTRRRWPLRLLTAPGYFQSHTAFAGVEFLRKREGQAVLHRCIRRRRPGAASRTATRCGCSTSGRRSGWCSKSATRCGKAWRWCRGSGRTGEAVSGTVNMLCSDRLTDMGEGATYQSTFLDIAPWTQAAE